MVTKGISQHCVGSVNGRDLARLSENRSACHTYCVWVGGWASVMRENLAIHTEARCAPFSSLRSFLLPALLSPPCAPFSSLRSFLPPALLSPPCAPFSPCEPFSLLRSGQSLRRPRPKRVKSIEILRVEKTTWLILGQQAVKNASRWKERRGRTRAPTPAAVGALSVPRMRSTTKSLRRIARDESTVDCVVVISRFRGSRIGSCHRRQSIRDRCDGMLVKRARECGSEGVCCAALWHCFIPSCWATLAPPP